MAERNRFPENFDIIFRAVMMLMLIGVMLYVCYLASTGRLPID